jgi:multiple sugar transport system permease protein
MFNGSVEKSKMQVSQQLPHTNRASQFSNKKTPAGQFFKSVLNIFVLIFLLLVVLVPILWLGFMSVRTPLAIFEMPPNLSEGWTFNNYLDLANTPFLRSMLNSLIISLLTTLFALGFGVPAAYALSRYQFKYERGLAFWILAARLALPIGFALPLFIIFNNIGIRNSYTAVVLAYLTFTTPLVIWVLRPFLDSIPKDLEEAAVVDGASNLQVFIRVIIPLSANGLVAVGVLAFVMSWIEFFYALIFTRGDMLTATVSIVNFMQYSGWDWGKIAAGGIVVLLPIVIFSFLTHRYLISGLTSGALKG